MISNQKSQFQAPIAPALPFARSAEMRKIARRARQAIFVDGIGRNLNERVVIRSLSHYPCARAQGRTAFPMIFREKLQ